MNIRSFLFVFRKTVQHLICCTVLLSSLAYGYDNELNELRPYIGSNWIQIKDDKRHQIKAFIRREENKSFRSFKVEMILNSDLKTLSNVLLDFDNFYKWYWRLKTIDVLKKISDKHYILYIVHDVPYQLPDLDVVLDATVEPQNLHKNYLTIKVAARPNYLPERPPFKRMIAEDMSIRITPIAKDKTLMEIQGYFEVESSVLPTWAANMIQRSAPYTVCLQLKRMTTLPEYINRKSEVDFPIYEFDELAK